MYVKNKYKSSLDFNNVIKLGQVINSAYAFECSKIAEFCNGLILIITPDNKTALSLKEEIRQFVDFRINYFPAWETLPYDNFTPNQNTISSRIAILYKISKMNNEILIISLENIMQRVFSKNFLDCNVLNIFNGQNISDNDFNNYLIKANYRHVHNIINYGEYKKNGSIFDIYSITEKQIFRIKILDNKISYIALLKEKTNIELKVIDSIDLLPTNEILINKNSVEIFRKNLYELFGSVNEFKHIYIQLKKGYKPIGIEYFQPLFFNRPMETIFQYLPINSKIILYDNIENDSKKFWDEIKYRYENYSNLFSYPLLKPNFLWLQPNELFKEFKFFSRIFITKKTLSKKSFYFNLEYQNLPDLSIKKDIKDIFFNFYNFVISFSGKIIFSVKENNKLQIFKDILLNIKINPKLINHINQIDTNKYYFMIGSCDLGFIDNFNKLAFICEKDFLNSNYINNFYKKIKNNSNYNNLICNLNNLKEGQYVVHVDHGIGKYSGLSVIEHNGIKNEYLIISYYNDDKLYVPVSSLYLVNRYSITENKNIVLNKLGNDIWLRSRKKAAQKIRDIAVELLNLYATRSFKKGYSFKFYQDKYELFCNSFPFKITPDQSKAIDEVLNDMCKSSAMDRLICGDVGFGKTEIAMRAAYLSVINKKQVIFLVPTTLLAYQHYESFCNRFSKFFVRIGILSRFSNRNEQNNILNNVNRGDIDILIGTHKILKMNFKWFDLGLLIIDEEHRFGVNDKEYIKSIYNNIDTLTLTATPIPRTLNIFMSGIRDLSLITTAPKNRLAVKTFLCEYSDLIVREAILREISRGGQVFYVFNNINKIDKKMLYLEKLIPEASFKIGHGKMKNFCLEKVMKDFHYRCFNVLICTTIIENGIDIPNVNTIIIDQVNMFGLSQLHQLRGRVGRSHHQAYAWLLKPISIEITDNAEKRLEAISLLKNLGSGFDLANYDLEIRGAGEILGSKQSGQIENLGFYLYMEMLNNAVNIIKNGEKICLENIIKNDSVEIDLHIPALLPDYFISNVNERLSLYKQISNVKKYIDFDKIKIYIINNYGVLPEYANNLIDIAKIRFMSKKMGIFRIESECEEGFFDFSIKNRIDISYVTNLLLNNNYLSLDGPTRLRFKFISESRIIWIKRFLKKLYDRTFN